MSFSLFEGVTPRISGRGGAERTVDPLMKKVFCLSRVLHPSYAAKFISKNPDGRKTRDLIPSSFRQRIKSGEGKLAACPKWARTASGTLEMLSLSAHLTSPPSVFASVYTVEPTQQWVRSGTDALLVDSQRFFLKKKDPE